MSLTFFNCDWGSTNFRLRAIGRNSLSVLAEVATDQGAARLALGDDRERPVRYERALVEGMESLLPALRPGFEKAPIAISGMASSSIGWQELPYATLPLKLDGSGLPWREMPPVAGHRVMLISGVRDQLDVLRGEETQAIGLVREGGLAEGCVILPGTHSKHLNIRSGQLRSFQTYLTGELFEVLSKYSLLSHSVGNPSQAAGWDEPALESVREGARAAATWGLAGGVFKVRARQLLAGANAPSNRAFLSGLLIGAEMSDLRNSDDETPIQLCAPPALKVPYCAVMEELGLGTRLTVIPADRQRLLSAWGQAAILLEIGWIVPGPHD